MAILMISRGYAKRLPLTQKSDRSIEPEQLASRSNWPPCALLGRHLSPLWVLLSAGVLEALAEGGGLTIAQQEVITINLFDTALIVISDLGLPHG